MFFRNLCKGKERAKPYLISDKRTFQNTFDQVEVLAVVSRLNINKGDRAHQNNKCFVAIGV